MKNLIVIIILFLSFQSGWSQQELNDYKYVIVPKNFDFQKGADSFQINSLTKFLLDKKGFKTIFSDEVYPDDLKNNQCLALKANLLMRSNFTRTTIQLNFTNCDNKIIYTSGKGTSKLKDYKKSYHEAIRNAFRSLDKYSYSYNPIKLNTQPIVKNEHKKSIIIQEVKTTVSSKPIIKENNNKPVVVLAKKEKKILSKKKVKKSQKNRKIRSIVGLYSHSNITYEISAFQNYFIFVRREVSGNSFTSNPLGFIYKTSKKGSFLVKTNRTFTGYLIDNGNFVIDEIADDGVVKSVTYTKTNN